ncbi:hypothetical protein KFL_000140090 [Klebsormidium nitens]|uniref:Uncharacterized protein n=1 Tax=Klebsormidium nitens TaxID=105231 RepID=A0A1Y1HJ00_KLENI|nr:hypothetical protein KFL_000140090 [Klebsormidium nitens]|eukprot:GAQ78490.1 hypothetical protein KFL_000140090 [Klebsormidium nitens]
MAWIQRVALLLQRCSTVPSLTRAGLGSNLIAPAAGRPSLFYNSFAAFARGAPSCRTYGVAARLDDEDAIPIPDFTPARKNAGAATPSSEAFEATRAEVVSTLSSKDLPRKRIVMDLIESASSTEHIDEMFELLKKLKIERAVLRQQMSPLNPHMSVQVALACARAGVLEKGLVTVQHRNSYGLRPSLDAAHVLIDKAGERNNIDLVVKVFRTLLENGLNPKSTTADLVMRAITRGGPKHAPEFFRFAEEFFLNGIKLWAGWYEKLMSRATATGDYKLFEKWARRREAGGMPVSKRVSFVMAKGYVLLGDAKRAADVLARGRGHVETGADWTDGNWDTHCRDMVTKWPTWLHQKRGTKVDFDKLKTTLTEVQALLKEQGVRFEVDVAKEFKVPRGKTAEVWNASEGLEAESPTEEFHQTTVESVGSEGKHDGEPTDDIANASGASASSEDPVGDGIKKE